MGKGKHSPLQCQQRAKHYQNKVYKYKVISLALFEFFFTRTVYPCSILLLPPLFLRFSCAYFGSRCFSFILFISSSIFTLNFHAFGLFCSSFSFFSLPSLNLIAFGIVGTSILFGAIYGCCCQFTKISSKDDMHRYFIFVSSMSVPLNSLLGLRYVWFARSNQFLPKLHQDRKFAQICVYFFLSSFFIVSKQISDMFVTLSMPYCWQSIYIILSLLFCTYFVPGMPYFLEEEK